MSLDIMELHEQNRILMIGTKVLFYNLMGYFGTSDLELKVSRMISE